MQYKLMSNIRFVTLGKETLVKVGEKLFKVNEDAKSILEMIKEPMAVSELQQKMVACELVMEDDELIAFLDSQIGLGIVESVA